jgi:hypothetical protein
MKTIPLPWTTVYATSNSARVEPASQWFRVGDSAKGRATLEIRELMGDAEVEIGIQVADVENAPGAVTSLTSYKTTNGVHYPTVWVGLIGALEGKQLFRFVYRVKNANTTDLNLVRVCGSVDIVLGN